MYLIEKVISEFKKTCVRIESKKEGDTLIERGYDKGGREIFYLEETKGKEFSFQFPPKKKK